MDDPTGRTSRGYSVSARGAFDSVDYSTSEPPLALDTALASESHRPAGSSSSSSRAAVPDPFDLADDPDDDGSQPTPTRTFFAFRPEATRTSSRTGSRAQSRTTSRATSRAGSPPPPAGSAASRAQSRSTSRAASRRQSVSEGPSEGGASRPTLALPQLTSAYLFLPLPNVSRLGPVARKGVLVLTLVPPPPQTDPLATLLSKFVPVHLRPPRDIEGHYDGQTIEQLVAAGSWRALARLARDTVVTCDAENVALIFDVRLIDFLIRIRKPRADSIRDLQMFHLRHLALLHLHLPSLHARELSFLFQAIDDLPPTLRALIAERSVIPFGLEVMLAQTKGVDALNGLVRRCKVAVKRSMAADEKTVWRERQRRVGVVLAGLLIDLGVSLASSSRMDGHSLTCFSLQESVAALHLLAPLAQSPSAPAYVLIALHRLHLLIGDVSAASRVRERIDALAGASASEKAVAGALESLARGEWEAAGAGLAGVLQNTPPDSTEALVVRSVCYPAWRDGPNLCAEPRANFKAATTLSVSQLYESSPDVAIATLEGAIAASPSATLIEPLIFNVTTLYELRLSAAAAMEKKIDLLVKVKHDRPAQSRSRRRLTACFNSLLDRSRSGKATACG